MIRTCRIFVTEHTDPYRNLALEEVLMNEVRQQEVILYLWQNDNTVVIGKNQNAWQECDVTRFLEEGGHVARRKSGGGAVYHDLGNQNYTLFMRDEDFDEDLLDETLRRTAQLLGIRAEMSGRNDLTVNGRKFSGCASYDNGTVTYRHGCVLISGNMENMRKYLTPAKKKLASKGVASVESRVINLSECADVTPETWREAMIRAVGDVFRVSDCQVFKDGEMPVDEEWLSSLQRQYADETWIFGKLRSYEEMLELKTAKGMFTVRLSLEAGRIQDAEVFTDAMDPGIASVLERKLKGLVWRKDVVEQAVREVTEN